jgi:putative sterol carrier protein
MATAPAWGVETSTRLFVIRIGGALRTCSLCCGLFTVARQPWQLVTSAQAFGKKRVCELERAGVVKREKLPPPASARVYALTHWGRGLEETVISLGRWVGRSPALPREAPIGADSVVLALKARFDPDAAEGLEATYDLRLGEDRFRIAVSRQAIEIARGGTDQPDATIDTDPGTLFAVLCNSRSLADAQRAGKIRVEGDKTAVKRLIRLFPLPEPAGT